MMTDRELLELAAKAYGYEIYDYDKSNNQCWIMPDGQTPWSPLTDDGDALRLAVKLKIGSLFALQQWGNENMDDANSAYEQDPYAATRRAIVRAAAEIGKDMKC